MLKTVGKKYAGGAAGKAGGQTEEYVKDHHEELEAKAGEEYDDVKAQAQEQFDSAKQVSAPSQWRPGPGLALTLIVDVVQNIPVLRLASVSQLQLGT
jgi:hypothetical protein